MIVSASLDQTVRVWDTTGKFDQKLFFIILRHFFYHTCFIASDFWSPDVSVML